MFLRWNDGHISCATANASAYRNLIRFEVLIRFISGRGPPMLVQPQIVNNIWRLLEELYLDSANEQCAAKFAGANEIEKRAILKDFVKRRACASKRWSQIVQNLLSADLDEWREKP
jgi:hypothetical protein